MPKSLRQRVDRESILTQSIVADWDKSHHEQIKTEDNARRSGATVVEFAIVAPLLFTYRLRPASNSAGR